MNRRLQQVLKVGASALAIGVGGHVVWVQAAPVPGFSVDAVGGPDGNFSDDYVLSDLDDTSDPDPVVKTGNVVTGPGSVVVSVTDQASGGNDYFVNATGKANLNLINDGSFTTAAMATATPATR